MSPQPLRLVHMVGSPRAGGAETFALRLLTALHHHPEVALLVLARKNSWLTGQLKQAGIPVEELAFGGFWDIFTAYRARRIVQAFAPHAVTAWMNRATRFMPKGPWVRFARLGGYYNLKNYRGKADVLIGNTQGICTYCINGGWPKAQVTYLPNFIPAPPPGWQKARAATRQEWGVPAGATVLFQSGRLHVNKGVDVTLSALSQLPATVHLVLAGNGPEEATLRQQAFALGVEDRVHFLGWLAPSALTPAIAGADIWLAPSRIEPLGNTVLEGWTHGIPVIASQTPGPLSLITEGKDGLLVPIEDATALATAITKLLASPALRESMGQTGLHAVQTRFGEEKVVAAYLATYRQFIAKGGSPHVR